MALDLTAANEYFDTNVLHNDAWTEADDPTKTRALNQASNQLYRIYSFKYKEDERPLPSEAIYEQALWLLKVDDTMRRAEQGVTMIMVDGIQLMLARIDRTLSPNVLQILGRKVGRSSSERIGAIV